METNAMNQQQSATTPATLRSSARTGTAARTLLTTLAVAATLTIAGCNIVAPAAFILHGPPKVPAAYSDLDSTRPTVIFIDDRQNKVPRRALRMTMGQVAERIMMERGIVDQASMISSRDAARIAAAKDSFNKPISVVDLAREMNAEVIIWVEIEEWTLSRDQGALSPTVGARVKIVDAKANQRIWPVEPAGWPLVAQVPTRPQDLEASRAQIDRYHEELAVFAGRELARIFYTYERDSLQSRRTD